MYTPLALLFACVIGMLFGMLLAASLIGIGAWRERRREPPPKPEPDTRCGCNHELSFHDGLGQCAKAEVTYAVDQYGNAGKDERGQYVKVTKVCDCLQYSGDVPDDWWGRRELA